MKLECIPFEMSTAVLTSIAAIRSKAQAKSIQIRHYFNNNTNNNKKGDHNTSSSSSDNDDVDDIPRLVVGDPNRIRQILLNLLQNSVKFTPEHGHISLSVTRIKDHDRKNDKSDGNGPEQDEVGGISNSNNNQDVAIAYKNNNMSNTIDSSNDDTTSNDVNSTSSSSSSSSTTTRHHEVRLRFEVVDNGIGIHPDRLADIFDKYQQADASIARNYGGTGLGLTICKRLVAAMNGSMGVTSLGLGRGSTFWMEIPFQTVPMSSSSPSLSPSSSPLPSLSPMTCTATTTTTTTPTVLSACIQASSSSSCQGQGQAEATSANQDNHGSREATLCCHVKEGGLHVLVAEDNTANQKLAKAMLKRLGHTVVIADNGAKAIEAVEKAAAAGTSIVTGAPGDDEKDDTRPFHVVLMDVQMPVMDGLEATRELRRRGFTHNKLAIIGLTADYQPSERQKYLDVGMNDCLGKPMRMNELRTFLAKTMLQQDHEAAAAAASASTELVDPV